MVGIPNDRVEDRDRFEAAAKSIVEAEIERAREALAARGVRVSSVELVRYANATETELRVYAYEGAQLEDALEVRLWHAGTPSVDLKELASWVQRELVTLA